MELYKKLKLLSAIISFSSVIFSSSEDTETPQTTSVKASHQADLTITEKDYVWAMEKGGGMAAPARTKVNIERNGKFYIWEFLTAATPLSNNSRIDLVAKDPTNLRFRVIETESNGLQCEFALTLASSTNINTPKHVKKQTTHKPGSYQYFVDIYEVYPPKEQQRFRYGCFVLSTLCPEYGYEGDSPDNTPNKKQKSLLTIKDERLYDEKDTLFSTDVEKKASNDNGEFIWILDKKGRLFATTMYGEICKAAIGNQHSFFLKSTPGKTGYGFGKPIPAGGHIKGREGLIRYLNNGSGHYKPNEDQFLLALFYLYKKGVLTKDFEGHEGVSNRKYTISDIAVLDIAVNK